MGDSDRLDPGPGLAAGVGWMPACPLPAVLGRSLRGPQRRRLSCPEGVGILERESRDERASQPHCWGESLS